MSTEMIDFASVNFDTFLDTAIEGELSTERPRLEDGDYDATIIELKKPRAITGNDGRTSVVMDVVFSVQAPEFQQQYDLADVKRTKGVFLDFTSTGALDMSKGKNVELGKLREAAGQNTSGKSILDLTGSMVKVRIRNTQNKKNPDQWRDEITAVAKA